MTAALLSLGDRAGRKLARSSIDRIMIQDEESYVIMTPSGDEAVLIIMTKPNAKLGLIFLDIKHASEALAELI